MIIRGSNTGTTGTSRFDFTGCSDNGFTATTLLILSGRKTCACNILPDSSVSSGYAAYFYNMCNGESGVSGEYSSNVLTVNGLEWHQSPMCVRLGRYVVS